MHLLANEPSLDHRVHELPSRERRASEVPNDLVSQALAPHHRARRRRATGSAQHAPERLEIDVSKADIVRL